MVRCIQLCIDPTNVDAIVMVVKHLQHIPNADFLLLPMSIKLVCLFCREHNSRGALQGEKAEVVLERDSLALELAEGRATVKDALLRMRAAEHKFLELMKETDAVLRFFPAQFPEASGFSVVAGRTCVLGSEGRPREATIRTALNVLRAGLDEQNRVLQVLSSVQTLSNMLWRRFLGAIFGILQIPTVQNEFCFPTLATLCL